MNETEFFDTQLISVVGGVVVPILVGVVTKLRASSGLKSILNAALSAITGAVGAGQVEDGWSFKVFVVSWAITFAISIASYYGLYKPTGIAPAMQERTAGFGLGKAA